MTALDNLAFAVSKFAELTPEEFHISDNMWQLHNYEKGEYFSEYKTVCKYLEVQEHNPRRDWNFIFL